MSRHPEETAAGHSLARAESIARAGQVSASAAGRSLPAPRKRPILLGVLAALYIAWLLALAWMAFNAR
jgi:hypothetical protein